MFVDRVEIEVSGGRGGDGCVSFRREKYVPRGGPDGGDGGDGGNVVIVAEAGTDSLAGLGHRKHWRAGNGRSGQGSGRIGACADDLTIRVPPGTVIRDLDSDLILKDLDHADVSAIVARGGRGGKGNTKFVTSVNRAPRQATPGGEGEHRRLVLELKMIADVGLIGKPNAGKSTLLARLSRARPKIAGYPFTTRFPNLGMVALDADRSFVMADIPGLIEGAHDGHGLGHEFLRHVERVALLVHLVEPEPLDGSDPVQNYRAIRHELAAYDEALARRPQIVMISKVELPAAAAAQRRLADETGEPVLAASAVTGQGLDGLLREIGRVLAARPDPSCSESVAGAKPAP